MPPSQRDEDLRSEALNQARQFCAATERMPSEVIPLAEEFFEFLKGKKRE